MDKDDIYKEYHDKVMRYILGKNISPFDAEDICQSVFIKIMNNLDSFDQTKSSISTWIYTITQNTVYTHYRTTSRAQKRFFFVNSIAFFNVVGRNIPFDTNVLLYYIYIHGCRSIF